MHPFGLAPWLESAYISNMSNDSIIAIYSLKQGEEFSAYAHPLRMRMLELLGREAMTLSQVAAAMGVHPANLSRHMRRLLGAGLARLHHTRDTGRNLEKYYRAVARAFQAPCGSAPGQKAASALGAVRASLEEAERRSDARALALLASLWLSPEDHARLQADMEALVAAYKERSNFEQ